MLPKLSASTMNQSAILTSASARRVECPELVVDATAGLGPFGLMSLSAKSRAHYLTLTYAGEQGRTEVMVIELGKDVVHSTLAVVEARSGMTMSTRTKRRGSGDG